jgi:hypothetical protein
MFTMKQNDSNLTRFDKFKTIFYLGLSCNFTSIVGCVAVWVALTKLEYSSSVFSTILLALCFAPIFMADAVNNYTLARIKLEEEKGWEDIQITPESRTKVYKYYKIYRAISILPAYGLASVFVASHSATAVSQGDRLLPNLKLLFLVLFILCFTRAMTFLKSAIIPRLPSFGGRSFLYRMLAVSVIFSFWFIYFWQWSSYPSTKGYILFSGFLYFILSGVMHPLPTRFSLLSRGKPSCESFLTIELINEEQLCSLSKEKITELVPSELKLLEGSDGFQFLRYFKMPLIELPLFHMWGLAFLNESKNILAIFFENEVKPGISCALISSLKDNYTITTNFHADGVSFPGTIFYERMEENQRFSEMLKYHFNRINGGSEDMSNTVWKHLESIFKQIIEFLKVGSVCYKKTTKISTNETED